MPALVVLMTELESILQVPVGLPGGTILRRVEERQVPSQHLPFYVTLEPLSTGVPAQDIPVRIECKDGVILNAVDQTLVKVAERACARSAAGTIDFSSGCR
jgi:hypothetical protein